MKTEEKILVVLEQIRDKLAPQPVVVTSILHSKDSRFIRNSDGTVTDKQLNLTWYPTLEKKFNWEEAKKECERMGCRLPTSKELFSLVDHTKHSPATDKDIFPDTRTDDWYWTSTPLFGDLGRAWCVGLGSGYVSYCYKGGNDYVRPVRSSQ